MSNPRIPRKPGQPANSKKHSDLYTDENPKGTIHGLGFKDVATAKASVSKIRNSSRSHAHKIQAAVAMEQRAREMGKTSEAAVYRKYINAMKKKTKKMNEAKENGRCKAGQYYCYTDKVCKPIPKGFMVDPEGMLRKENGATIDEEGLRDWFGKSKSKDGKKGWVQVVSGKPCARQPGQKSTPKCVSSAKRASMSKSERLSAQRRKRAADPNQPQKSGAAKPTYVSTDKPKSKMKSVKESVDFVTLPLNIEIPNNIRDFNLGLMFRESLDTNSGMLFIFEEVAQQSFHMTETRIPLDIAFIREDGTIESIKELEPFDENPVFSEGEVLCALEVNRGWFEENNVEVGDQIDIEEGKKDACYHKVKSRYSVWPSAYASGALVKCRKVGAANWGNKSKTKKEEFELDEKCWKGYEKKGMKTMFGKRYPNCVKKTKKEEVELDEYYGMAGGMGGSLSKRLRDERLKSLPKTDAEAKAKKTKKEEVELIDEKKGCMHNHKGEECPVHGKKECPDMVEEAVRMPSKTGNVIAVSLNWRGKFYMIKMFFPSVKVPSRAEIQSTIETVYPGAKVQSYQVSEYEPGQPVLHAEGAAWTKKAGKNKEGGLNEKGRKSYERENPGSDLKAPSKKVGNPRRASFCARMKGMKKKLTSKKTANDPDSRINKSLRAWNC